MPKTIVNSRSISDTSPESDQLMLDAYRRMTAAERIERVSALNQLVCSLALTDIHAKHPDADERECLLRLASRRIDPLILRHLVDWDVAVEGY